MHIMGEFLGYFAGICTALTFLPQAVETIKSKNVAGLSLFTYVIYCLGILSWILYGIYLGSIQMIIFNTISLVFGGIILFMIINEKRQK